MGGIERLVIAWITEDRDRLGQYLALVPVQGEEEQGYADMRELMAREIPHCGEFWRELMLEAIAGADWRAIAEGLTDRRQEPAAEAQWLLVERRKR